MALKWQNLIIALQAVIILVCAVLLIWSQYGGHNTPPAHHLWAHTASPIAGDDGQCNQRIVDRPFGVECNETYCPTLKFEWPQNESQLVMIVTSKSGLRFEQRRMPIEHNPHVDQLSPDRSAFEVLPYQSHQKIVGFGGALSDSACEVIQSLPASLSRRLMSDYFGQNGIGYTIARISIGGSDFSSRFYTNNDLAWRCEKNRCTEMTNDTLARQQDFEMNHFRLMEEDFAYKIPMLQLADSLLARGENPHTTSQLKVLASMWTAPVWLKTNKLYNKGSLVHDPKYYGALAELKRRFIEAYAQSGVCLWALTVLNEPIMPNFPFIDFNTMIFTRDEYHDYLVHYLGPKLSAAPHPQCASPIRNTSHEEVRVKLFVHDDNRRFIDTFVLPILDDPRAASFVDGIAVHGYLDDSYTSGPNMYYQYPKKLIMSTELSSGHLPYMEKALVGNWHRGVHYMLDILHNMQNFASAWIDWNAALDMSGGPGWLGGRLDAPILVDAPNRRYFRNPMFYAIGHFSRFVGPGAQRIELLEHNGHEYDHAFHGVAFVTADAAHIVMVVVNANVYAIPIDVKCGPQRIAKNVIVPADSFVTLVWKR